ncbi:MAG: hypothetical protein M1832_003015 [Thelocarpon impressellum]|nr:MAG: hypothetical protein M1832_003015 [Thelocarpon impressellum]
MATSTGSSPLVRPSSRSSRAGTPLSLDLSSLPPLVQPSPPTNTLLITNLIDPAAFRPEHLLSIRNLIDQTAPVHSWAPLKSFRRIVVSFYDVDTAIRIRQLIDGEAIMGYRVRVFFGETTPIEPVDQHLHAPQSQKMFFISPPPSPPHGWESKNEEPPNKAVYAADLASALAKLHAKPREPASPISPVSATGEGGNRARSGSSTMIYDPKDHGDSPHLPAIAVEDTTEAWEDELSLERSASPDVITHTARPPLELLTNA